MGHLGLSLDYSQVWNFFHPVSQTVPSGTGVSYFRHAVLHFVISLTLESFHLFAPSHLFICLSLFPPKSKRVDASYSNGEISQGPLRHPPAEAGGWVCLFSLFAQPLVCIKIPVPLISTHICYVIWEHQVQLCFMYRSEPPTQCCHLRALLSQTEKKHAASFHPCCISFSWAEF